MKNPIGGAPPVPAGLPDRILRCVWPAWTAAPAIDIKRVVSPGGIEAWLVQDTKVPLLSIKFFFKGGVETDPTGKEGLANLTSTLLDEGAGPYDSEEFQRRLADINRSNFSV